jgi:hypothetical protein
MRLPGFIGLFRMHILPVSAKLICEMSLTFPASKNYIFQGILRGLICN